MRFHTLVLVLGAILLLQPSLHAQRERFSIDDLNFLDKNYPNAQKTSTGIRYVVQKDGEGEGPNQGDTVNVLYEGRLLDGTLFDKATDKTHPFSFRLGRKQVIAGWDQIVKLMKPGEKLLAIIPSELAYGSRGQLPRIPRDSALIFTIELISINRL
ncbi:MAG: FKBP-type peptidyl-prolyl cis-trans isomerase [Verrucomicrobia bacterium]|jgi:FKBP-type peptidyl-prolyl cis-trans isomerase|nr:MAG: FKBP-type peptidyl-prolyl cis-trans isomerase [Verrucomicrobiota bacterium]